MFNANNVLDRLVEALREGGEARVREVAKALVSENYAYVEATDDSINEIVTDVLAALNDFDKERALSLITDAPNRLQSENEDEDEDDEDEESGDAEDLITRVTALEKGFAELRQVAVSRGLL